ncbi:unnamed protein product, partial [Amoebophrya sp. A25]
TNYTTILPPAPLHPAHVWTTLRVFALIWFGIYDTFFSHGLDYIVQKIADPDGSLLPLYDVSTRNGIAAVWMAFCSLVWAMNGPLDFPTFWGKEVEKIE